MGSIWRDKSFLLLWFPSAQTHPRNAVTYNHLPRKLSPWASAEALAPALPPSGIFSNNERWMTKSEDPHHFHFSSSKSFPQRGPHSIVINQSINNSLVLAHQNSDSIKIHFILFLINDPTFTHTHTHSPVTRLISLQRFHFRTHDTHITERDKGILN